MELKEIIDISIMKDELKYLEELCRFYIENDDMGDEFLDDSEEDFVSCASAFALEILDKIECYN